MSDLHAVLEELSQAHGPSALAVAHRRLQKAVQRSRRTVGTDGALASAFRLGMQLWDQQKAEGGPLAERVATLTAGLKATWPYADTAHEWKYFCATCDDSGAEILECPARPCDRRQRHGAHTYLRPCFCKAGNRWRERVRSPEDALTAAASTSKPRTFTKVGRG